MSVGYVRHFFGTEGEFVEYPIVDLNEHWRERVDVSVSDECDTHDGVQLFGCVIHRGDKFCIVSCGGFLAYLNNSKCARDSVCISISCNAKK